MSSARHYVHGELYLSLETIAETYQIHVLWLTEVYERGLLGKGVPRGDSTCVAAFHMERVATIIRLHHRFGVSLESIPSALEEDPQRSLSEETPEAGA